jgi:pro-kumamolisin-like protein/Big-like domain-containing protein
VKNPPSSNLLCLERSCFARVLLRALRSIRREYRQIRLEIELAAVLVLLAAPAAFGQGGAVPARVTDRVDLSQLTTLAGNTHRLAQAQFDQGAAPPDLPMNRILLVLQRSPEQDAALQDLLNQQQITSSANFHKWLTPDQFGQQFGLADADLQAVTSWLASFGFQSIQVAKGRNLIEFSGTAAQVQAGLHTAIHQYFVNGEYHWANASDPQIPTALAPVIAGVASLNDFHPKPTLSRLNRSVPGTVKKNGAQPQITLCTVNQTPCPTADVLHALVPADFDTIYNVNSSTMTGSGLTIGIVAVSNISVSDVTAFRNMWGLPSNPPTVILNGPDPGDTPGSGVEGEAVLDATWAGAIAPLAAIRLVVSEDTNATSGNDLSEFYIIDNNLADVMTESFASCESQFGSQLSGFATMYSGLAEQAAAQGITYAVSSGDGGPDACDDPSTIPLSPAKSVNILAATPFNVAVGGSMFNEGANSTTYWSANNNPSTGGSALSYIPEDAWNEACTTLSSTCAVVGIWSTGGGISSIFSKPPWQKGVAGLPNTTFRSVPDVAMNAANHDGYVICIDGSCGMNPQQFGIASGTSASVQVFGGVMALVDQKMGGRVGLANYALYTLAAGETYANCNGSGATALVNGTDNCIFNDVTVGNTNLPTTPAETGFAAGPAYDETTGLGSVNVSNLVNQWSNAITKGTTTALTLNNNTAVNVPHGTSVPVGIVVSPVAPATGTPTGDVSLIANSANDEGVDSFTLSGGSVSSTATSTNLLPGGSYQVHAHYEGDGTFLGSDSTPAISVTVTPEASKISFGIVVVSGTTCSTPTTVTYGSPYVLTVDVSSVPPASTPCAPNEQRPTPTGTVTLMDSFNGGTAALLDGGTFKLNSGGYFEDQPIQLPAGSHNISASYAGDNSFNASGPVSSTVVVTQAATTAAVAASQTTISSGTAVTLTATVSTQSNATASASQEPTGSVQFLLNGSNLASASVTGGVNQGTMFAQATASINPVLAAGQDAITAKYLGDSNYAASAASPPVTVNVGTVGINVSPGCASSTISVPAPGRSGTCLINATGANGFTGTITLTTALTNSPANAKDVPTCSFGAPDVNFTSPNIITLTPTSESGNATMTCSTTAASQVLLRPSSRPIAGWPFASAAVFLACGSFFLLAARRLRRWGFVPLAVFLVMIGVALAGCGSSNGGGGGGQTNPGTTTGNYTFTITATPSAGTAQTTTVTVNVQ